MLVLSRHVEQTIVIGGPAVVRVLGVRLGTIKLGIVAPADTEILRGELVPDEGANTMLNTVYRDTPETSRRIEAQAVRIRALMAANETLCHEIVERDWTIEEYRQRFTALANRIEDLTPECEACGGDPSTLVCVCGGPGCQECGGSGGVQFCGECGKAAIL